MKDAGSVYKTILKQRPCDKEDETAVKMVGAHEGLGMLEGRKEERRKRKNRDREHHFGRK